LTRAPSPFRSSPLFQHARYGLTSPVLQLANTPSPVIGLTGGIASGKSTVSHYLSTTHHLPIIDADLLARTVLNPGTSGYSLVISHFGPDRVLLPDGINLDRSAIGEIVFNNPDERRWLNGVIHPRVRKEIVKEVVRCWVRGEWAVVVDVPLLIEAGLWKWVGEVVVVYV
jgi:dephospho-CoA kinase